MCPAINMQAQPVPEIWASGVIEPPQKIITDNADTIITDNEGVEITDNG